jgi:hypothetical protein
VRENCGSWDRRCYVGGVVSGNGDVAGESKGELGQDGGVEWID